mmetsp:Transcript_20889/g.19929  ORF Transcript_20889/g.19929 Transcript_20889/m.19929 type:complete len:107 (+) Transcript_20889:73-393(+)
MSPGQNNPPQDKYDKAPYTQDNQLLSTNAKSGFMSNGENEQLRVTVNSNQAQPLKFNHTMNQSSFRSSQHPVGRLPNGERVEDLDQSRASQSMNQSVMMNESQVRI